MFRHEQAEDKTRLQAMVEQQRRFASDAAHELRTPIAGLRATLEEWLMYPADVDPEEAVSTALSTVDQLDAIIGDLLALAHLRAGDPVPPRPLDLTALVAEAVASRPDTPPVHITATTAPAVYASRLQILRLLDNLLANAQRHAVTRVDVVVECQDGEAVISVTDDGCGVPPKDRERIFERFVRLEDARRRDPGGTGLGLAISRETAEAHGGTLRMEDSPKGARFVLRLPLQKACEGFVQVRPDDASQVN